MVRRTNARITRRSLYALVAILSIIISSPKQVLGQCPFGSATTISSATTVIGSGGIKSPDQVVITHDVSLGTGDTFYISGTLELSGNISTGKNSNIYVCSGGLLVIRGNLALGNQANVVVRTGGTLIVLGNVDGAQGNIDLDNDGKIVLAGTVTLNENTSMTGSTGVSYIFDSSFVPKVGAGGTVGNFDDLILNDPALLDLFSQYACPSSTPFTLTAALSGANIVLTAPSGYATYDFYAKMPGSPDTVVPLSTGGVSPTLSVAASTYLGAKQFVVYAKTGTCFQAATAPCIPPVATLSLTTPSPDCNGPIVKLDVAGGATGSKYSYYMDGSNFLYQSSANSFVKDNIGAGTHAFKVDVVSANGCNATTNTVSYTMSGSTTPTCSCGGNASYQSIDNRVENWSDASTWMVPDWLSPKVPAGMGSQPVYIKGTVTYTGNLSISGGHFIADTLIVKGDLTVNSYSLKLCPSSVLIVLGNYNGNSGGGGSTDLQGRVIVDGLINNSYSNTVTISNGGHLYGAGGATSTNGISGSVETKDNLQANDPSLYDYYMLLKCGGSGVTGGTILPSVGDPFCFTGAAVSINSTQAATPAGATYSWQGSVDSGSTWFNYGGTSAANTVSTMDLTVAGSPVVATILKLRRVATSGTCSASSNTITAYRQARTGATYHISNDVAK
ncbi:hypothetical protein [uncultured Acetobacteroides sp.]|uniref:hypothetical protein n=1 Tax=uncultured Acetobacteroides sp. TaxID=1760811 RepID=UPI0029F5278A|nr:hypothetical protein [uncultured Acetobacteroides sp.]